MTGRVSGFGSRACLIALLAGAAVGQDCDQDGILDSQQTFRWQANGAAFWGSPSAWQSSGQGAPGGTSLALFDGLAGLGSGPYFAFMDGFTPVRGLGVLNSSATFDLGGSVFSVSGTSEDCREFLLGGALGATLTVTGGGQFRLNRSVLGDVAGTLSRLTIDASNESLQLRDLDPSPMIVGQFGLAEVDLLDASFVHSGPLVLGSRAGSGGSIFATGSSAVLLSAEVASDVSIGFAGDGLFRFEDQSTLLSNGPVSMRIGERALGLGELTFAGTTQPHSVSFSTLTVGGDGVGSLRVVSGAELQSSIGVRAAVGLGSGSDGSVDVLNFGTWLLDGKVLELGPGGRAELSLGEGSIVDSTLGVVASVDGVVRGSGLLSGDLRLIGGEIRPTDDFAESSGRQQLFVDGDLHFNGVSAVSGEFETGRMVYTVNRRDPRLAMSAAVSGEARLDGTLRVRVPIGFVPAIDEPYPVIEAGSMTGVFDAVQTVVIEDVVIAVPGYSGNGDAFVEFVAVGVDPSVLQPSLTATTPGDFVDAVVVDVTEDGFPDLVTLATNGAGQAGVIRVARNLGVSVTGDWLGFDQNTSAFSSLGDLPGSIVAGDMNGDGLADLVVMNRGPADGQVRIRLNSVTQPGDFGQVDPREISVAGTPADITLADLSGDGTLDVITVFDRNTRGGASGGIRVSENTGGGFDDDEGDTGDDPGSVDSMGGVISTTGVAVTSKTEHSVYVFGASAAAAGLANRGPQFPLFFLQEVPAGREPDGLFTADLNGDGLDDVITSDRVSGTISVLFAQDFGEIVYTDAVSLDAGETPFSAATGSVVALDVNDDGRLDLVFTARDAQGLVGVRTILNIGEGDQGELIFSESRALPGSGGATPRVLAVADLDGDGVDDLVVVREPTSGVTVSSLLAPGPQPCGVADVTVPFGVLDLSDINAFVTAFLNQQPLADLSAPFGVYDLSDVGAFIAGFVAGCP